MMRQKTSRRQMHPNETRALLRSLTDEELLAAIWTRIGELRRRGRDRQADALETELMRFSDWALLVVPRLFGLGLGPWIRRPVVAPR